MTRVGRTPLVSFQIGLWTDQHPLSLAPSRGNSPSDRQWSQSERDEPVPCPVPPGLAWLALCAPAWAPCDAGRASGRSWLLAGMPACGRLYPWMLWSASLVHLGVATCWATWPRWPCWPCWAPPAGRRTRHAGRPAGLAGRQCRLALWPSIEAYSGLSELLCALLAVLVVRAASATVTTRWRRCCWARCWPSKLPHQGLGAHPSSTTAMGDSTSCWRRIWPARSPRRCSPARCAWCDAPRATGLKPGRAGADRPILWQAAAMILIGQYGSPSCAAWRRDDPAGRRLRAPPWSVFGNAAEIQRCPLHPGARAGAGRQHGPGRAAASWTTWTTGSGRRALLPADEPAPPGAAHHLPGHRPGREP